jgi:hypothetical protein
MRPRFSDSAMKNPSRNSMVMLSAMGSSIPIETRSSDVTVRCDLDFPLYDSRGLLMT